MLLWHLRKFPVKSGNRRIVVPAIAERKVAAGVNRKYLLACLDVWIYTCLRKKSIYEIMNIERKAFYV